MTVIRSVLFLFLLSWEEPDSECTLLYMCMEGTEGVWRVLKGVEGTLRKKNRRGILESVVEVFG